eukprot:SAG22_NODE_14764_length_365_cov_1.210526_1_plen_76_part_01
MASALTDELEDSDLSDSADPPGQDAAQREWNAAVSKGAKALLAARDNARKQLHTRKDELADVARANESEGYWSAKS